MPHSPSALTALPETVLDLPTVGRHLTGDLLRDNLVGPTLLTFLRHLG